MKCLLISFFLLSSIPALATEVVSTPETELKDYAEAYLQLKKKQEACINKCNDKQDEEACLKECMPEEIKAT